MVLDMIVSDRPWTPKIRLCGLSYLTEQQTKEGRLIHQHILGDGFQIITG